MSDQPRWRLDLIVCAILAAGLLVTLSVLSYDPADAPSSCVYPPRMPPANLLGRPGAWLADGLHQAFGVAVYALLVNWFVLVVLLFQRRALCKWSLRLAGWLLMVPCTAILADALPPGTLGGPISGCGGHVGAWLSRWLEGHLTRVGLMFLCAGWLALGLALTADFALAYVWRSVKGALRWVLTMISRLRLPGRRAKPDIDEPVKSKIMKQPPRRATRTASSGIPIHYPVAVKNPDVAAQKSADMPASASELLAPIRRLEAGPDSERFADFELPPLSLLEDPKPFPYEEHDQKLRDRAAILEKTFIDFGLNVRVVGINTGPVITQYEVALETGLRLHKVTRLADDLALNLKVPSVRTVAPIPGKNTVGVEIPNDHRAVVRLKEVILTAGAKVGKTKIPLFLGKDTEGRPLVYDLAEMPHLLIAGRTGTGKSVCMNAIILSILMTRRPDEVKMIMIDPKMLELSEYGKIPHLMHPVVKDMKKAEAILSWAVDKMEERYDLLSRARVRSIAGYNELSHEEILRRVAPADDDEQARIPERMPYIVIFVDEMNDLMMTMKKEVEGHIIRLAQKSRAAGIHLVVATQKPTVDVITGLIKSNLPARICFQVSSRSDSRVVLDEMGADKLLGKGDMLFLQPGTSTLMRAQGTYTGDEEISRVVERLECDPCYAQELVQLSTSSAKGEKGGGFLASLRARDEVYEQAIDVVVREGRGSVSLLQRALGIGYGRAARLVDFMAEDGIVGDYNGSQARDVLYTPEQWQQMKETGEVPERAESGVPGD
jgi:S-DNA-T family DNA segregation ATPase FtsK/SpoIIIE